MVEGLPLQAGLSARGRAARFLADPSRLVVLLACAVVLSLRREGAWTHPQFWAEDNLLYEQAYVSGAHALLAPMSGYLLLVPRLVAALAAVLDPALAPWVLVAGAFVATLYVASRALAARCPLPRLAGACALAVVLVPDAREILLNLANLQWVLGAGLVLLLVSGDPESKGAWAHDGACAAAIGLTGPFCILLAPLFLWRAWSRRTRASAVLAVLVAGCALVQGGFLRREPAAPADLPGHAVPASLLLPVVGRRIGGSLLLGPLQAPSTGVALGTVAGLATLAGVGFLALREGTRRRERVLLGAAFALLLAGALLRTRHTLELFFVGHLRARYVFLPQLLAAWLLLAAAAEVGPRRRLAAWTALWALAVNLPGLRAPAYLDMHWADYAARIRAGEAVEVPTNMPGRPMRLPARPK